MLSFAFDTFPVIETERLILREFTLDDLPEVYELRTNQEIMQHIDRDKMKNLEEARDMVLKMQESYQACTGINWGITLKTSPVIIGGCGFWRIVREHYRAEIGYSLLPDYWNQGIITEAIHAVVHVGFHQVGIHSIEANLNPENKKSARVLEKNGFIQEGYFKQNYFYNGKFYDTLTYGKTRET